MVLPTQQQEFKADIMEHGLFFFHGKKGCGVWVWGKWPASVAGDGWLWKAVHNAVCSSWPQSCSSGAQISKPQQAHKPCPEQCGRLAYQGHTPGPLGGRVCCGRAGIVAAGLPSGAPPCRAQPCDPLGTSGVHPGRRCWEAWKRVSATCRGRRPLQKWLLYPALGLPCVDPDSRCQLTAQSLTALL